VDVVQPPTRRAGASARHRGGRAGRNEWRRRQAAGDEELGDIVDLDGYTENCLGLTSWTTGYAIASANFEKNLVKPWAEREQATEEIVESDDSVVIRQHIEVTHVGKFLGIPATNRRIGWGAVTIVRVNEGRVVGAWIQPDLWSIHQQLTGSPSTD
jgi:predicted ester cyclase